MCSGGLGRRPPLSLSLLPFINSVFRFFSRSLRQHWKWNFPRRATSNKETETETKGENETEYKENVFYVVTSVRNCRVHPSHAQPKSTSFLSRNSRNKNNNILHSVCHLNLYINIHTQFPLWDLFVDSSQLLLYLFLFLSFFTANRDLHQEWKSFPTPEEGTQGRIHIRKWGQ